MSTFSFLGLMDIEQINAGRASARFFQFGFCVFPCLFPGKFGHNRTSNR